jgi:23S rRNA (cytidine1920-2'-O)/16S rRNA (cytidine1409-2'-O)-methyltransferase
VVAAGRVLVGGAVADKPSRLVAAGQPVVVEGPPPRFVSRGGEKLDAALARFAVEVAGRRSLDAGASTGGFTDCLLQRGAAHVVALDVGRGQLHPKLRADPRVTVFEGVNVRTFELAQLTPEREATEPFDVVTADLAFISLVVVVPTLVAVVRPGGDVVLLVKPQFEVGRAEASRGRGVVRDPELWREALVSVASALAVAGAGIMGAMVSPLTGPAGNTEFFLHARPGWSPDDAAAARATEAAVGEALARRGG